MARPLDLEETTAFDRLKNELTLAQPLFDTADAYYDGQQRLEVLGLAIPPELARFTVIVNWPGVVVDAIADRLDVKGFRLPGTDVGDPDLYATWVANGMVDLDLMARLDYLIYGRTYKCVGVNEDGTSRITVESPRQIITRRDPRTNKIVEALRLNAADDGQAKRATWYLENETRWMTSDGGPWQVDDTDEHGLDRVPVVPTFRRRRTTIPAHRQLQGASAMENVIPVTDAAARNISNAQLGQETHAVPQRGVLGATKGDFIGSDGKPLTAWEAYFGAVWALGNKDAKTFQFDASDMQNFERMMDLYARLASGTSGLPPNYFGLAADDAASADAIRSRESRLVKIAERDQVALGVSDAEVLRISQRLETGSWNAELNALETLWYDAGTPTTAARADAVVKLYAATDSGGRPLMPREMAMEELGWSPTKIKRALELLREEERDPVLEQVARDVTRGPFGEQQSEPTEE